MRSLLSGSWADGMVPHIVFHARDPDYSPGPELWDSASCPGSPPVPTSGITQPPVFGIAVLAFGTILSLLRYNRVLEAEADLVKAGGRTVGCDEIETELV